MKCGYVYEWQLILIKNHELQSPTQITEKYQSHILSQMSDCYPAKSLNFCILLYYYLLLFFPLLFIRVQMPYSKWVSKD
jgi:hypothetical protein